MSIEIGDRVALIGKSFGHTVDDVIRQGLQYKTDSPECYFYVQHGYLIVKYIKTVGDNQYAYLGKAFLSDGYIAWELNKLVKLQQEKLE